MDIEDCIYELQTAKNKRKNVRGEQQKSQNAKRNATIESIISK